MCGRNVSLLSRVTPSVLTVSKSGTAVPARSTLESEGKECRRWHEPNRIASDLFGFMAKPLKQNHAYIEERHSSSFISYVIVHVTDLLIMMIIMIIIANNNN